MIEKLLVVFDSIINLIDNSPKRTQNQLLTRIFFNKKTKKSNYFLLRKKNA